MKNTNNKNSPLKILNQNSSLTMESYAKECYNYTGNFKLDDVFLQSFAKELQECGHQKHCKEILAQLQRNPVLQTAHHLTPTNGPTLTAIDLLSLLGLEEKYYLVGVFSGVSFSNTAFSGSLCYQDLPLTAIVEKDTNVYQTLQKENASRKLDLKSSKEQKIRLISSLYKDDLIYKSSFEKYRLELWDSFTPKTLEFFPKPQKQESVLNWNLHCCANLQRKVFQKKEIIYFDICRLICNYLLLKLEEKDNPLKETLILLQKKAPKTILFYSRKKGKKSWKIQPLSGEDLEFSEQVKQGDFALFRDYLKKNTCPSAFLVFLGISFFLGIRVLGSFNQISYLPHYENILKKIFPSAITEGKLFLSHQWEKTFTFGKLTTENGFLYPLDYAFQDQYIDLGKFKNKPISQMAKFLN